MNTTLRIAAALSAPTLAIPAVAQTAAKDNSATKAAHTVEDGGVREGANSFTEKQARDHIAKSGFSNVSPLKKDNKGVWRGTAVKGGHTVPVGLDFKGDVSTAG